MTNKQLGIIIGISLFLVSLLTYLGYANNTFLGEITNVNTTITPQGNQTSNSDISITDTFTQPENFAQAKETVLFGVTVNDRRGYQNIEEVTIDLTELGAQKMPMILVYKTNEDFFIGDTNQTFFTQEVSIQNQERTTWFSEENTEAWFITQIAIPENTPSGKYNLPISAVNKQGRVTQSVLPFTIGEVAQINENFKADTLITQPISETILDISDEIFVVNSGLPRNSPSNIFMKVELPQGLENIQQIHVNLGQFGGEKVEITSISSKVGKTSGWFLGKNIVLSSSAIPGTYQVPVEVTLISGEEKTLSTKLTIKN